MTATTAPAGKGMNIGLWVVTRLVAVAALCGLGFGCAGVPLPREQLTDPGALLFNGYVRPEVDCFRCHNGDGKGARGPSLERKVPRMPADRIAKTIRKGEGLMPKFPAEKLSDEEMQQVIAWLKSTFP